MSQYFRSVVVVATQARHTLLERSLASIAAQTQPPARILIVVDGEVPLVASVLARTNRLLPHAEVLGNSLTPGASGAWNTAMRRLEQSEDPDRVVVSFLDDDDWWEPDYLARVQALAPSGDVVAAAFWRHDADHPAGREIQPPPSLRVADFLVGNPGIQGSNLSIRLTTWLEAGGFDEALRSCTDRDLCIRLADIGARLRVLPLPVCHHDTLHGQERLSDSGSANKRLGLDAFFAKHAWRMTPGQREAFCARAHALFQWSPSQPTHLQLPHRRKPVDSERTLKLVVGLIVDGDVPQKAERLVSDLARLAREPAVGRMDVVLLENGDSGGFARVVAAAGTCKLFVWPVEADVQRSVAVELGLDAELPRKKSIAESRTLLHRFVATTAELGEDSVAWILDDDMRLPSDLALLASDILRARDAGFDVAIGTVEGDPPIPVAGAVRTQLVDLVSFLAGAAVHGPQDPLPAGEHANAAWMQARRDYYHDHPRSETDRLETPFLPVVQAPTVRGALVEVGNRCLRILTGEQIFRPLLSGGADPLQACHSSCMRGGNTLVFDLSLLREAPNLAPRLGGRYLRRSDTLWAVHARHRLGRNVVALPLALHHDRSDDPPRPLDHATWADDILGHAFARAYEDHLVQRHAPGSLPLEEGDRKAILRAMQDHADARLAACRVGAYRIRGAARALERLLDGQAPDWLRSDPDLATAMGRIRELARQLHEAFSLGAMQQLVKSVQDRLHDSGCEAYLTRADRQLQVPAEDGESLAGWKRNVRIDRARRLVADRLGRTVDAVLGMGCEGVVVRCGTSAIKVYDRWSRRTRQAHLPHLRRLFEKPVPAALPEIFAIHEWSDVVALDMACLEGTPYAGGQGPGLLAMLRGLVDAGWVHTNVHPKNLLQTSMGTRLVDVGSSLQPQSPESTSAMVRRAWLAWRFAYRSDLAELMHKTIDDQSLPELTGWQVLQEALAAPSAKLALDALIEAAVATSESRKALDYGCGRPRPIHDLLARGQLTAFDVDPTLHLRWKRALPSVPFVDVPTLEQQLGSGERFDTVVCSLVLCAIPDMEVPVALDRVRRAVDRGGQVLVSVCDPTALHTQETAYQTRHTPQGCRYGDRFAYRKTVRGSGRGRVDFHRPLDWYRRAFARAGLQVVNEETVEGFDVQRFERLPEFRLFRLRPLADLEVKTSLLIKACAMEAEALDAFVRHAVRQVGQPRAFDETVVVFDRHGGPFPRAWTQGELTVVETALARLVADGVVDRVVEGPRDGQAAPVSLAWFHLDHDRAHVANGQAALAFLSAVEQCRGDLVLHLDADVLLGRPDPEVDLIAEATRVFADQSKAVTWALPVHGDPRRDPEGGDVRGPYRVEAMAGWIHKTRLLALRPLPNSVEAGLLALPWHRAVDRVVRTGLATSLRRGSNGVWYAAADNARKPKLDDLFLLMDRIEAGHVPACQTGLPLLSGPVSAWHGPKRQEPLVVVVCGRNVAPGRIRRCMASLVAQTGVRWGAVVIDDASDDGSADVLSDACRGLGEQVTLVQRRRRLGLLANTALAIGSFVADPEAVVVLLDLDDALASPEALAEVWAHHQAGVDVTVGSMVRTDKQATYLADFTNPRDRRGGNVWQHLRSFRKRLFDRIRPEDLRDELGWIELANDWAFMLPIVEMSRHPVQIKQTLYLHEPSTSRPAAERQKREAVIAAIVARPSYRSAARAWSPLTGLTVLCYHRIVLDPQDPLTQLYARRGLAVSLPSFVAQMRAAVRHCAVVSAEDVLAALRGDKCLPPGALLVTFDDGFRDFVDLALPVLARSGVPGVQFARVPEPDGLPSWAPLDLLRVVLTHAGVAVDRAMSEVTGAAREDLLRLSHADQLSLVSERAQQLRVDIDSLDRSALYADIGALRDATRFGISIAGHGRDHERWTQLSDENRRTTLATTADWLDGQGAPRLVAYPDGALDARLVAQARSAGFAAAFGLAAPPVSAAEAWTIPRVLVPDDPLFVERLVGRRHLEAA